MPVHIDRRTTIGVMAIMLCFNAGVVLMSVKAHHSGRNDFPIFYSNAQMVHEGKASGLYDFDTENSFIRRVTDTPRPPNNHLPYELLFFVPFTYLDFGTAYIVWTILGLTMLAGVAVIIRNLYGSSWSFSLTLLTILAFYPELYCLLDGQDSIVLLLLFAASFWLWKQGKDDVAGFVMALGLFRPQIVLPFIFIAFLAGKWKLIRGFIPGAALVVALSAWVVGVHGMVDYARILLSQGTEKSASVLADQWEVRPGLMPTWRGFLWVCVPSWVPSWLTTFFLLSGTALVLGWAAKKMRAAKGSAALDITFAIVLATVLLVSFHSYLNDFGLMILPLLICSQEFSASRIVARNSACLIVSLCFLLFLTPLYLVLFSAGTLGWLFLVQAVALWLVSGLEMIPRTALDARGMATPAPITDAVPGGSN